MANAVACRQLSFLRKKRDLGEKRTKLESDHSGVRVPLRAFYFQNIFIAYILILIMSKREMIVYDIASVALIILFVSLIITFLVSVEKFESRTDLWNALIKTKIFIIISAVLALIYTIAVLFLIFKKEKSTINLVFMIIGSIILVGILPCVYYFTHLRKIVRDESGSLLFQVKEEPQLKARPLPSQMLQKNSVKTPSKRL